jgi:hypothetical protein
MEGREVQFEQTFLTCSHFSKAFYHVSDEEVCGMQTAILHSQGNLLIRSFIKNFSTCFNSFSADERMETPISSMTKQQVPKSIYRYFHSSKDLIAGWFALLPLVSSVNTTHHDKNVASIYLPSRWHSYEE